MGWESWERRGGEGIGREGRRLDWRGQEGRSGRGEEGPLGEQQPAPALSRPGQVCLVQGY